MTMESSHIEAIRSRQPDTGPSGAAVLPGRPRCAAIIAANPAIRSAGIEAAAVAMAKGSVASVRVGNPLASPLTLQRILFQMDLGGGEDDADADDEARLVRLLEKRRGAQDRIILVVERAETLDPAALPRLQRIASAPGAVHILFVGGPAFWPLLDDAELAPLRRALTGQGTEPAAVALPVPVIAFPVAPVRHPASATPDRPVDLMVEPRSAMSARSGRRWWIAGAVGAGVIVASSVAAVFVPGGLFYYAVPQWDMPTPPGRGGAADKVPPSVSLRLAPPMTVQAGPVAPLALPSSLEGRVVIHYRGGSGSGEVEAARLAAAAAPLAAKVQTRMVADTPSAPMIRFFHPEDAERARQLADALGGSGPRWDVRDFSSFRPSPSPGTVEVWTPAR